MTSALLDSAKDWLSQAEGEALHRASNSAALAPLDGPAPAQKSTAAYQEAADPGGPSEDDATATMIASMAAATITPRSPRSEFG